MGKTSIEYVTDTWNPIIGCTHSGSPGCDNCYAARLAATRLKHHPLYKGLAEMVDGKPQWTGEVRLNEKALEEPLRARKPRRYLVCSMGDLFYNPYMDPIMDAWEVMYQAQQHKFLVLTKRPEMAAGPMHEWLSEDPSVGIFSPGVLPNVWLGATVESQAQMWRVEQLLQIPAAGHWVSLEPCLGPIDDLAFYLKRCEWCEENTDGVLDPRCRDEPNKCYRRPWSKNAIDFVVLGGETGPNARPMHPDWARKVRDDCVAAGTDYFFKGWGEWRPAECWGEAQYSTAEKYGWPRDETVRYKHGFWNLHDGVMVKVGKKAAGRELDGRTWEQLPKELLLPSEKVE